MSQSAAVRPEPTPFRKAAITLGAAVDHTGSVDVQPIPNFDLDRTIFKTLESPLARFVMKRRIGKEVHWREAAARSVDEAYSAAQVGHPLPPISAPLVAFLLNECDFDVEHADGSFLDHLYFCFEYGVHHYPQRDPLVMFLHSILGTGTNTFAMPASKIEPFKALVDDFAFRQIEAFPSLLRLLYTDLPGELRANAHRIHTLVEVRMHRVIDNVPIVVSAEDFWIGLNYQLMHLVDFLPVANWEVHRSDTNLILFRELHGLLVKLGKLEAKVDYRPATGKTTGDGEPRSLAGTLISKIPESISFAMSRRAIARFSEQIGHSLAYEVVWA